MMHRTADGPLIKFRDEGFDVLQERHLLSSQWIELTFHEGPKFIGGGQPMKAVGKELELPFDVTRSMIQLNHSLPSGFTSMPSVQLSLFLIPSRCRNSFAETYLTLQTTPAADKAHGELTWNSGDDSGAKGGIHGFERGKISSSMNSSMT